MPSILTSMPPMPSFHLLQFHISKHTYIRFITVPFFNYISYLDLIFCPTVLFTFEQLQQLGNSVVKPDGMMWSHFSQCPGIEATLCSRLSATSSLWQTHGGSCRNLHGHSICSCLCWCSSHAVSLSASWLYFGFSIQICSRFILCLFIRKLLTH